MLLNLSFWTGPLYSAYHLALVAIEEVL